MTVLAPVAPADPAAADVENLRRERAVISDPRFQGAQRRHAMVLALGSLIGTLLLVPYTFAFGLSALDFGLFAGFYALTLACMTVGFHRGFGHHAFDASPSVRLAIGAVASMAAQGPLIYWVANHRRHHWDSDGPADPHSPHRRGPERIGGLSGYWHAHMGWMFTHQPTNTVFFARSLLGDPVARAVNRTYLLWVAAGLVLPAAIGGVATGSLQGALGGFLWGGPARIFAVLHVTGLITSATHVIGRRDHETPEGSRNVWWLALPTFGESWHNNHHAFPRAANFGLRWWQFDLGWCVIRALRALGLVRNVIVRDPTAGRRSSEARS